MPLLYSIAGACTRASNGSGGAGATTSATSTFQTQPSSTSRPSQLSLTTHTPSVAALPSIPRVRYRCAQQATLASHQTRQAKHIDIPSPPTDRYSLQEHRPAEVGTSALTLSDVTSISSGEVRAHMPQIKQWHALYRQTQLSATRHRCALTVPLYVRSHWRVVQPSRHLISTAVWPHHQAMPARRTRPATVE